MITTSSVSEVVSEIKLLLEGEFRSISVEGEVSNLSGSAAGHWYFTLSDKNSSISSALFKMDALRNPLIKKIKNGDKIICHGGVGVYSKRGTFQIIAKKIMIAGKGDLKERFEELKKSLAHEGLFDLDKKMQIPEFPKRVAVITAQKGAAFQDFINIFKRRSCWTDILLVPALVQGDNSAKSLLSALQRTISYSTDISDELKIDVIVITRGGGSFEDLWPFNDEALARAISSSPIPIISAVGHQVDFSISDFVADFRCETPSAAAELLSEGQNSINNRLDQLSRSLLQSIELRIAADNDILHRANPRKLAEKLWALYYQQLGKLDKLNISDKGMEILKVHEKQIELDESVFQMKNLMYNYFEKCKSELDRLDHVLRVVGPRSVLSRGYSYVTDTAGSVVSSSIDYEKIEAGEKFCLNFHDGIGKGKKIDNVSK